jgi:ribonuclease Z
VAAMVVTMLGTGSPTPTPDRFGPSVLVQAGGQVLMFDAGRGATIRMRQLRVQLASVNALFLTHYHSDHTAGVPDVWLTRWIQFSEAARATTPFNVIGPTGARELMENLQKAYAADIRIRTQDIPPKDPKGIAVTVQEFSSDGVVYEQAGVKVTAFEVDHGAAVKPAYGYRIDHGGRSAVISGDTTYNENLVKHAANCDLLIHEVACARPELMQDVHFERIMSHHTIPRMAGTVFARAKPRLAVYTHFILRSTPEVGAPTLDDVVAQTRETYSGPIELGEDLMSFEIGDTIAIRRFGRT